MEIFYNILRTTIKAQLNSTHLGHWISNSHQKWLTYLDTSGQIVHVDAQNEIPVHFTPIDMMDNTKILGTKSPPLPENQTNQNFTPMQLVQNTPNWLKKIWRTTKWTEDKVTKIIENANLGQLVAAGTGAI